MPLYDIKLYHSSRWYTVTTEPLGTLASTLLRSAVLRLERRYTKEPLGWRTTAVPTGVTGCGSGT